MINRKIRCAVVDLKRRSASVKSVTAAKAAALMADAELVLSTGVLTGTGAPGTGVMAWSIPGVKKAYSEGRLGAYMRYAGVDAIVFKGQAAKAAVVYICDGKLVINEAEKDKHAYENYYKTDNTVIALTEKAGVMEDDGFYVADAKTAAVLKKIGVAAIVADGKGAVAIADSRQFVDICVELYKKAVVLPGPARKDQPAVRFLTNAVTDGDESAFAYKSVRDKYASLGIHLGSYVSSAKKAEYIAKLVAAVTGKKTSALDVEAAGKEDIA